MYVDLDVCVCYRTVGKFQYFPCNTHVSARDLVLEELD